MELTTVLYLVMASVTLMCGFAVNGATDEEILQALTNSCTPQCGNGGKVDFAYAISLCESDTNRLERLIREVAERQLATGEDLVAESAIWKLGRLGTTNSLPFLYSCVTNPLLGNAAMVSIVQLEGINSNSVDCLSEYLAIRNAKAREKIDCCCSIMNMSQTLNADVADKRYLTTTILGFGHSTNTWSRLLLDEKLMRIDPSYQHSRRRLAFIRTFENVPMNDADTNFVTNTINELVAYPESALGD